MYHGIGKLNRSGWLTFLREKTRRQAINHLTYPRPQFIPRLSQEHDRVLLVSYPRSGNSMLRQRLENLTNIVTGSDSRPLQTLSKSLLRCGYLGEGITDSSVWIVKSHFPERLGFIQFKVARIILLVRNPFDALTSYFHMGMTDTHDKNLSNEVIIVILCTFES